MSQMFATLDVARSGMGVYKLWIDALADNVANIDNVSRTDEVAFQERFVVVQSAEDVYGTGAGGGARVIGARYGDPEGRLAYEPTHPMADENGLIRRPDIDLSDQMVMIQLAQRGYQANIQTFERAREAYEAALTIGQ